MGYLSTSPGKKKEEEEAKQKQVWTKYAIAGGEIRSPEAKSPTYHLEEVVDHVVEVHTRKVHHQ